jgi:hypothetical protein
VLSSQTKFVDTMARERIIKAPNSDSGKSLGEPKDKDNKCENC